ncbi:hypothetical protein HDU97_005705 [Phlyctochytrium planicorne]|nr:hypothetical protein HDU97_005705 [Phlyctochytrium planicorne]
MTIHIQGFIKEAAPLNNPGILECVDALAQLCLRIQPDSATILQQFIKDYLDPEGDLRFDEDFLAKGLSLMHMAARKVAFKFDSTPCHFRYFLIALLVVNQSYDRAVRRSSGLEVEPVRPLPNPFQDSFQKVMEATRAKEFEEYPYLTMVSKINSNLPAITYSGNLTSNAIAAHLLGMLFPLTLMIAARPCTSNDLAENKSSQFEGLLSAVGVPVNATPEQQPVESEPIVAVASENEISIHANIDTDAMPASASAPEPEPSPFKIIGVADVVELAFGLGLYVTIQSLFFASPSDGRQSVA